MSVIAARYGFFCQWLHGRADMIHSTCDYFPLQLPTQYEPTLLRQIHITTKQEAKVKGTTALQSDSCASMFKHTYSFLTAPNSAEKLSNSGYSMVRTGIVLPIRAGCSRVDIIWFHTPLLQPHISSPQRTIAIWQQHRERQQRWQQRHSLQAMPSPPKQSRT